MHPKRLKIPKLARYFSLKKYINTCNNSIVSKKYQWFFSYKSLTLMTKHAFFFWKRCNIWLDICRQVISKNEDNWYCSHSCKWRNRACVSSSLMNTEAIYIWKSFTLWENQLIADLMPAVCVYENHEHALCQKGRNDRLVVKWSFTRRIIRKVFNCTTFN